MGISPKKQIQSTARGNIFTISAIRKTQSTSDKTVTLKQTTASADKGTGKWNLRKMVQTFQKSSAVSQELRHRVIIKPASMLLNTAPDIEITHKCLGTNAS